MELRLSGWHLECSVMSIKYLGDVFDIHGVGWIFCSLITNVKLPIYSSTWERVCRYWIHNNMITINGQKMARSLGNFITLDELFSGNHKLLEQAIVR